MLGTALQEVQDTIGKLGEWAMASQEDIEQIYKVGLNTTRLLMATGDLVIAWLLLKQAEVAIAALDSAASDRDVPFYQGKVATAKWFARNRLPLLAAERAILESTDDALMELADESF